MAIYLVRHPQTKWNLEKRFQGGKESAVTKKGKKDSVEFIRGLKINEVNSVWSADNNRCKYLANLLVKKLKGARLVIDSRLNERSFGIYEGRLTSSVADETGFNPKDLEGRYVWVPEGGESLKQVGERVKDVVGDIRKENGSQNVIVITSGGVMKTSLHVILNIPLSEALIKKFSNLDILEI